MEETRISIDQQCLAGSMVSEAELRRTAALEAIAAMGTEDERLLHSLITRNEEVVLIGIDCTILY